MLPKGLMNMVIGFMLTVVLITTKADPRVKRYQVAKGDSGRYMGRTNPGDPFICHYYVSGAQYEVSDLCEIKNKNGTVVEGKRFYSWFYPGTGSYPACPALPEIRHGYWMCPINVWYKSVEVYAVCAAKCLQGYHMEGDIVVRCPESLMWNNFTTPQCSSDHHPPKRPEHVHVQVLNTSAVNVSWTSPKNDTSAIGYTVHITCNDDYSLTLNSTKDSLIIPKLEILKNYTITVTAFNQYKASLKSDPVYVELLGEKRKEIQKDRTDTDNQLVMMVSLVVAVLIIIVPTICVIACVLYKRNKRKCQRAGGSIAISNEENIQMLRMEANMDNNSLLKEIDKVQPMNKSRSEHQKGVPRSDSGRGSVTGSSSTTSDLADMKLSSSQGSNQSDQGPSYIQTISVDSGRDSETDQEECFCTIAAFIDSPNSYQHLADLGDLLDPDDHYGQQKSWKGFVKDVLQLEHFQIIAMAYRQKGNSPFQTEVLDYMKAKGTKIGHLVSYFSRSEHLRPDVLNAITKFHLGCKFCDTILAQHKLCDVKENEISS